MANVRVATFGFTEVVLYPDLAPLYTIPAALHVSIHLNIEILTLYGPNSFFRRT